MWKFNGTPNEETKSPRPLIFIWKREREGVGLGWHVKTCYATTHTHTHFLSSIFIIGGGAEVCDAHKISDY